MNEEELKNRVNEMLETNQRTIGYYFDVYDELSDEREALHDDIIREVLNRKKYTHKKLIFMLGGAPANGKSSFIKAALVPYPSDALKIDPDEIKTMLPEYQYLTRISHSDAAAIVHEESSYISKELRGIAIEKGFDLILDGVANDTLDRRKQDVALLKENGHWIRIDYITLDTELSLKLANLRFKETGRMVPETIVREYNKKISILIPQIIENHLFDELYLWDTNIEKNPRLILSQKSGKLEIISDELFSNFKRKASE